MEGVNWDQAALYLALTLARERVEELELQEVIPIWKKAGGRGRHPGITTKEVKAPLQEDKDWGESLFHPPSRGATVEEKKLILSLTGCYAEPLDRQIMERVQISSFKGPVLMNRRNEMGGVRIERMQYRRWGGN